MAEGAIQAKAQAAPLRIQYGGGGCSGLRPRWPPLADKCWIFNKIFNNIPPNLQKTIVIYNFLYESFFVLYQNCFVL